MNTNLFLQHDSVGPLADRQNRYAVSTNTQTAGRPAVTLQRRTASARRDYTCAISNICRVQHGFVLSTASCVARFSELSQNRISFIQIGCTSSSSYTSDTKLAFSLNHCGMVLATHDGPLEEYRVYGVNVMFLSKWCIVCMGPEYWQTDEWYNLAEEHSLQV